MNLTPTYWYLWQKEAYTYIMRLKRENKEKFSKFYFI